MSMSKKLKIEKVDHVCLIVNDIKKSIERVSKTFDIPPVEIEEYSSIAMLKGKKIGNYKLKLAMVKIAENMILEFLEITGGKSVEQDWVKRHGETIHHIAIKVDDMEEEAAKWESRGIRILQEDHGKWIYLDTEKILGMNVELVPAE